MKNRRQHDPLALHDQPHQMLLQDMNGQVLERRPIPAGTDLKAEMLKEVARWEDAGWLIERDPERRQLDASFYMRLEDVRRLVTLLPEGTAPA